MPQSLVTQTIWSASTRCEFWQAVRRRKGDALALVQKDLERGRRQLSDRNERAEDSDGVGMAPENSHASDAGRYRPADLAARQGRTAVKR